MKQPSCCFLNLDRDISKIKKIFLGGLGVSIGSMEGRGGGGGGGGGWGGGGHSPQMGGGGLTPVISEVRGESLSCSSFITQF